MTPFSVIFALVFIGIFSVTYRSCLQIGKRTSFLIISGAVVGDWVFTAFSYLVNYRLTMSALAEATDDRSYQEFKTKAVSLLNESLLVSLVITVMGLTALLLVARKFKKEESA